MDAPTTTAARSIEQFAEIIGADNVITDAAEIEFFATDVFRRRELPQAVLRPGSAGEIARLVKLAGELGCPIVMRGGGASYTDAYAHTRPGGVTLDFSRMKAINIDEENLIVHVEPGVTWRELHDAVQARGLKTRFWGSYSGLHATVAGSTSMHAISHGQGTSADAVVSMEIITGTGERLATGSALSSKALPFSRHYGPDLTGLFTGDCGALGIKTRITLALTRAPPAFTVASFDFAEFAALHAAFREIGASGLVEENFGLNAALQQGQLGKADLSDKVEMAGAVMKSSRSLAGGIGKLAKMALAGDKALKQSSFAGHFIVEGLDQGDADRRIAAVRELCAAYGKEIPASVPEVVRAMPFAPFHNVLGPKGERWLPMHCQLPHGAAVAFHEALEDYWASQAKVMALHGIYTGGMFMAIGSTVFIYEPTFYWPGARTVYHERIVEPDYLARLPAYDEAPDAEQEVLRMRKEVIALMHAHGGVHYQIGRSYPYLEDHDPAHLALVRGIKRQLDPHGILNPGVLGM